MTWQLTPKEYRRFPRNTLELVVAELKFHPILVVPKKVDEFQDRIRLRFPQFRRGMNRVLELAPGGAVEVKDTQQFIFSTADDYVTVALSDARLSLEHRRHSDRQEFQNSFAELLATLTDIYGDVTPVRLGLRYVNSIYRDRIEKDLQRQLRWSDLIAGPFISALPELVSLDDTLFFSEISSVLGDGRMTVRHGIVRSEPQGDLLFRLDLDRFFEGALDVVSIKPQLERFSADIYNVFRSAASGVLLDWMEKED